MVKNRNKMKESTFIELCVKGEESVDKINDYIEKWHDGNSDKSLFEFLGMTREEYQLWIENWNNATLKHIIELHRGVINGINK